jgi:DNA polymerase III subunit delta'
MPFRDIVGHRRLVGLLARSVQSGSLPPSLIFAGPTGVGKRLAAVSVAQALNCTHPQATDDGSDACGVCPACKRIARGVHPDVLIVEPGDSGSIKIDQVREIVDRAEYRPFEGKRRAVIIDQADALIPAAQNALLKTLEEPPPSSVFMLVTARADTLLATVRSRCPRLQFRPLSPGDIASVLMTRNLSETEARAVAATADGSVGRALETSAGELVEVREIAQRVLAHAAEATAPGRRLEGARELSTQTRDQLALQLRAMASLLRDVEVLATRADDRALANADVRSALERLTPAYGGERGVRAFTAIDRALVALERNAGVKVVADWLVLQL